MALVESKEESRRNAAAAQNVSEGQGTTVVEVRSEALHIMHSQDSFCR
jgi:hypothetical protein